MYTYDNCGVGENDSVQDLTYLISDGSSVVYKAYSAKKRITDAHAYRNSWPVFVNTPIHRTLNNNVIQQSHA